MLVLFAVIFGGIVTGRLLQSRRLAFVSRLIAVIIWALLFLLGLEVGSDPAVVGGMATLGRTAFVIFVFSVAGSIGASWLLWRRIRVRSASGTEGAAATVSYTHLDVYKRQERGGRERCAAVGFDEDGRTRRQRVGQRCGDVFAQDERVQLGALYADLLHRAASRNIDRLDGDGAGRRVTLRLSLIHI